MPPYRRRRRVRVRWIVLASVLLLGIALARLLLGDPGWYRPPDIDPGERQQVRNSLVAAEQAFTEALLTQPGPFVYHLHQDDLNRWLAMRREIYPLGEEFTPPELADPFVRFDHGRIVVAGRFVASRLRPVVTLEVRVSMEEGDIVLRASRAGVGGVRLPMTWFGLPLDKSVDRPAETTWPGSPRIWGSLEEGLRLDAVAWWKNGGTEYRVRRVWVEPSVLHFEIEPLGPHFAERVSDHLSEDGPSRTSTRGPRSNRP